MESTTPPPTPEEIEAVRQRDKMANQKLFTYLHESFYRLLLAIVPGHDPSLVNEVLTRVVMRIRNGEFRPSDEVDIEVAFRKEIRNRVRTLERQIYQRCNRERPMSQLGYGDRDDDDTSEPIADGSSASRDPSVIVEEAELAGKLRQQFLEVRQQFLEEARQFAPQRASAREAEQTAEELWHIYQYLYEDKMTQEQIADRLGMTRDKIRTRIKRVEEILKKLGGEFE